MKRNTNKSGDIQLSQIIQQPGRPFRPVGIDCRIVVATEAPLACVTLGLWDGKKSFRIEFSSMDIGGYEQAEMFFDAMMEIRGEVRTSKRRLEAMEKRWQRWTVERDAAEHVGKPVPPYPKEQEEDDAR